MQQAIGALILALYLGLTALAAPLVRWILARRAEMGREDPLRWREKLGVAGAVRPEGQLLWLHAASVGELLSVASLVQALAKARPSLGILVTTSTITSAKLAATRLPAQVVHQYLPLDTPRAVTRFLNHWHPDVAVWVESEFWPRLIEATAARGVPMLLVNARVSDRSARRWRRMGALAQRLLAHFSHVLAQDAQSARNLLAIGLDPQRLTRAGSLKESATPLPVDAAERARLLTLWSGRPRWLAASTHAGEEAAVFAAHRTAAAAMPGLLLILAPRHPIRGPALAGEARAAGLRVAERSSGAGDPAQAEVYLADTLGEMGLWFDLAPVAFLGGSLVAVGGHNPYEPIAQGAAVLHGANVGNFREVYARLDAAGAALAVADATALAAALPQLLANDAAAARAQAQAARALLAEAGEGAEAAALAAMLAALDATSGSKPGAMPL